MPTCSSVRKALKVKGHALLLPKIIEYSCDAMYNLYGLLQASKGGLCSMVRAVDS